MKRDTLRTIGGLVLIGIIVVATFLYGNHQRQDQTRHDQDVKRQQQAVATTTPTASAHVGAQITPVQQPAVTTPTANPLQASRATPTPTPTTKPTASAITSTPRTGPAGETFLGMIALAFGAAYYYVSRRRLLLARRSSR